MALTPEQLKSNLASLTPSDVKKAATKKVKPLITPSPTTPTTKVIPEITSVKPLAPKQNIMSPSLEVQAGVQAPKDYKSIASENEKTAFKRMLDDGLDPKLASETLKYAIDRRLTQENIARGQEPKNYVVTPQTFQEESKQGAKNIVGAALDVATGLPKFIGQGLGKGAEAIASGLGYEGAAQKIAGATEKTFGKEGTDIGQDVEAMSYKAPKLIGDIASVATAGSAISKIPVIAGTIGKLGSMGTAGKIAVGALEGAGSQGLYTAQSEQRLPTVKELAVGGAIGGAIPALGAAFEGAKKVLPKISDKADDAANKILTNMNRITKGEQEKFAIQQGKTVGERLKGKGIISGGDESIDALAKGFKASKDKADEGLSLIKGEYKNDYLSTMAREASDFADNTLSPQASRMKELADKANDIGLTMSETNEVKRFFERNNKFTYGRDITAGEKTVRATNLDNYVRNRQLDIAEQNGFSNLKEINKDTQGYKYLLDKLIKNENGRLGNNAVTLTDWIVAGEVAANPQAIALLVGKKVASSNWFRKGVVKILNKLGNAKSEADRLVDIAKIQRIQNEKDLNKFLSLPYKKDTNIPTYPLNSSSGVKGVVRPITPTGVIQETTPLAPKPTVPVKKTVTEVGRATHNPYTPKVEPVKETVPVLPKPKKQSVLSKTQEKQAILDGKKDIIHKAKAPKELQPLYQEAKKYKSAEEFVDGISENLAKKDIMTFDEFKKTKPSTTLEMYNKIKKEMPFMLEKEGEFIKGVNQAQLDKMVEPGNKGRHYQIKQVREEANKKTPVPVKDTKSFTMPKEKSEGIKVTTKVPVKETNPLLQEAKKYKSAEDFIKAGQKVDGIMFRGEGKGTSKGRAKFGIGQYFSENPGIASDYGDVSYFKLPDDLKLIYGGDKRISDFIEKNYKPGSPDNDYARKLTEKVKKLGYDGVEIGGNVVIYDRNIKGEPLKKLREEANGKPKVKVKK